MSLRIAAVRTLPDEGPWTSSIAVIYNSTTDTPMGRFFYDMVLDPDDPDTPFASAQENAKAFLTWYATYNKGNLLMQSHGRICALIDEWHEAERKDWQVA